jgi:hypothetical protein
MKLIYTDGQSLGPFQLGMNVQELDKILGQTFREKKSLFYSTQIRRYYQKEGLFFDIVDKKVIIAIEILNINIFDFDGKNLFKFDHEEMKGLFFDRDPQTVEKDGFTSKKLRISTFFEIGKKYPSSIIIFSDGYYDRKKDYDPLEKNGTETTIDDLYKLLK